MSGEPLHKALYLLSVGDTLADQAVTASSAVAHVERDPEHRELL